MFTKRGKCAKQSYRSGPYRYKLRERSAPKTLNLHSFLNGIEKVGTRDNEILNLKFGEMVINSLTSQ
jgi:hypothetical protein